MVNEGIQLEQLDALLVILQKATSASEDSSRLPAHELVAVITLLRPLLPQAPRDRQQLAQALLLAASSSLEHDAVAAAPALSCVQVLLAERGHLSPTARKLFWWVLELTRHSEPKVRDLAQRTGVRVLEARPPLSALAASFAEVRLSGCSRARAPRGRVLNAIPRVCRCTPPRPSPQSCCWSSSGPHSALFRPPRRTPPRAV